MIYNFTYCNTNNDDDDVEGSQLIVETFDKQTSSCNIEAAHTLRDWCYQCFEVLSNEPSASTTEVLYQLLTTSAHSTLSEIIHDIQVK